MEYYTDRLKQATLNLAASSAKLDLDIRHLPLTSTPDHRNAIIAKFKRQHYARRSKIKQDYGVPVPESTGPEDKTFPLLELPPELQDLVWKFTLPGPRIVPILPKDKFNGLTSPCAPPVTLHVCRASRDVALQCGYELAFLTPRHPAPIYFNFAIDTAYIDSPGLFGDLVGQGERRFSSLDSASRIRKLALGLNVTLNWSAATYWTMPRLEKYASLETLFLATYLCDEWLNYGNIKPSKISNVLLPHLGLQAIQWKRAIKNWQGEAIEQASTEKVHQLSIDAVEVLLITNSTLRPWMCRRVLDRWDSAMAKDLKTKRPEYILDPSQVAAAAKSKLAVFDSIAHVCNAEYAEKAYVKHGHDHSHGDQWESQLRGRLRTYEVRYW